MEITLFLTIFFALATLYLIIGLRAAKHITTNTDYFLAGRNLGLWPIMFTLVATQIGGGMLLGTSEHAYKVGYYGILYTLSMALGFIILGSGLASRLQSLNVSTTAELFETRYGSTFLKKVASLLSILTMCGLFVAQVVASKTLLFGLGITHEWVFLLLWTFIITYTMIGGLRAVAFSDMAQVTFIITVFTSIFFYCLYNEPASFFSLATIAKQQMLFSLEGISFSALLPIILMPALFSLIEQDLAQRFFAARTKKIAATAAIGASVLLIAFALIPVYFGIKAKLLGLIIPANTSPLVPVLEILTHNVVLILAVCGIIAALTSTADSLLCAVSSNLAQDFDFSWLGFKQSLKLSKTITLIIGIAGVAVSYFITKDIIKILVDSYELSVSCLFIPLIICYFTDKVKKEAAFGSVILGLAGFVLFRIWPIPFPKELATLGLSLLGYLIGTQIKKAPPKAKVIA